MNPKSENQKADAFGHLIDVGFSEIDLSLLNQLEQDIEKIDHSLTLPDKELEIIEN